MNLNYEKSLYKQDFRLVLGLDEAGRGAWAGPIVAGCIYLDPTIKLSKTEKDTLEKIKDSKKLKPEQRELIYKFLTSKFIWSVGEVDNKMIDKIGIGEANKLAFRKAVTNINKKLKIKPDYLLIDYFRNIGLDNEDIVIEGIKFGDDKVMSIAATSIIAKVYRDRKMVKLDKQFPEYGFGKHKGYGTKLHRDCLKKFGVSEVHRLSYKPMQILL